MAEEVDNARRQAEEESHAPTIENEDRLSRELNSQADRNGDDARGMSTWLLNGTEVKTNVESNKAELIKKCK